MGKRKRNSRAARKSRKAKRSPFQKLLAKPFAEPVVIRLGEREPEPALYYTTEPEFRWADFEALRGTLLRSPPMAPPMTFVAPRVFEQLRRAFEQDERINRGLEANGIPVEQWPALQAVANLCGVPFEQVLANLGQLRAAHSPIVNMPPRHMMTQTAVQYAAVHEFGRKPR